MALFLIISWNMPIYAQKTAKDKGQNQKNTSMIKGFTKTEKRIITSGKEDAKLHVYQITDEQELSVLKSQSSDIHYNDPLLPLLEKRMFLTVQDPNHPGVGIAAPQIGINRNLIWVQRFDKPNEPFEFYINPKIIWRSQLVRLGAEGCLSIPDRKEDIQRSYAIRLSYQDKNGNTVEENIEGFTAVIFQHEVDHLFGILYPDRLEAQQTLEQTDLNNQLRFSIPKNSILP